VMVPGNNDFFSTLPRERTLKLEGFNIWITHGHNYYVSMDPSILKSEAAARGADIVMFGHTHRPIVENRDGLIAVNPGSISYPRQENRKPSYILMEFDRLGDPFFTIKYLDVKNI